MKLSSDDEAWLKIRNKISLNFNINISFVFNIKSYKKENIFGETPKQQIYILKLFMYLKA